MECSAAVCEAGDFLPAVLCSEGGCPPAVPVACDDANECTDDSCDPLSGCLNTPDTAVVCHQPYCDGLSRYVAVNCAGDGTCPEQADFVDCDDGNDCTTDACDAWKGCINTPQVQRCVLRWPGLVRKGQLRGRRGLSHAHPDHQLR